MVAAREVGTFMQQLLQVTVVEADQQGKPAMGAFEGLDQAEQIAEHLRISLPGGDSIIAPMCDSVMTRLEFAR